MSNKPVGIFSHLKQVFTCLMVLEVLCSAFESVDNNQWFSMHKMPKKALLQFSSAQLSLFYAVCKPIYSIFCHFDLFRVWCQTFIDELQYQYTLGSNDCIRNILHVRCTDCVATVEPRHHLRFTCIPAQLSYRRFCWFDHAVGRPGGELIWSSFCNLPHLTWRMLTGDQLKMWATSLKKNLEPLSGPWFFVCAQ